MESIYKQKNLFSFSSKILGVNDIVQWRDWFYSQDLDDEQRMKYQWYNMIDWNNTIVSSQLINSTTRSAWAKELGISVQDFQAWYVAMIDQEDNIEDTDAPEKSEFMGNEQRAIDPEVKIIEDQEVEIQDMQSGDDPDMEETKNLLNGLRSKQPSIPGLDLQQLVDKRISSDKTIQASLKPFQDTIDDPSASESVRNKAKNEMNKQLKLIKNKLTEEIQTEIDTIRSKYKEIVDNVKGLTKVIPTFITGMVTPKCIGSPPVSANPVTSAIEAAQFKATCSSILNQTNTAAITLLASSMKIGFSVPDVVKETIESISTLSSAIDSIPG